MTTHTFHPDSHTHGLADDCPRCAEHAEHPTRSLDDANFAALVDRYMRDLPPRSENERKAMQNLARIYLPAPHGTGRESVAER